MENPRTFDKDNGVREATGEARAKAEQVKDQVVSRAEQIKEQIASKAARATSQLGEKIEDAGESMRERYPSEGRVAGAARAVATRMEHAGSYIKESGFRGMTEDVAEMVRRHPVRALLLGAGLGYLIGRFTRR